VLSNKVTPFLMFEGTAEEAMGFYVSLFDDSAIQDIVRYGKGEAGAEGSVVRATFTLAGQSVICIDSPAKHEFGFTPSFSFFVECETEEELDSTFSRLVDGGRILMPPDNYGFSTRFTWVSDRFGVSWQLNLH
jgi:predicted 3-demethylubiquinone-9 3-methyltransferase (glyoxalase superfamily)